MSAAEIFRLPGQSRTRIIDAPAALARRKQSLAGCFAARLDVDRDLVQTAMQSTFRTGPAIGGAALTANIGSEKPQSLQRPVEDSPYVEV